MRKPALLLAGAATAAVAVAAPLTTAATSAAPAPATASTTRTTGPDPADFARPRANPYFPLRPGTVTILRGRDEGTRLRERVVITHRTRVIQGIRTRVVSDVVRRADGSLAEKTTDWYAADNRGNVWYFGEDTATYDQRGRLESRDGTWLAGRDGARAGVIMPANPHPTQAYRQEFYPGHAEDQAWIVANSVRVRTPLRTFTRAVRTFEWTRLEPDVVSAKFYARGVGIVKELDVAGGNEMFHVVSVRHGG